MRDEQRVCTFAALDARVNRLAEGLTRLGVESGARVLILSRNRIEYVELYFALFQVGAVAVPVNWRLRDAEVSFIATDARATHAFAEPAFLPTLASHRGLVGVVLDEPCDGWISYESLLEPEVRAGTGPPARDLREDAVAVQMYTSGTTGRPKGSMLTHRNVSSLTEAWLAEIPLRAGADRFLQVTPLFHVGALLMMMSTVAAGASLRLLPEFVAPRALAVLRSERITRALFVPAMVQWLLAERDVRAGGFEALLTIVYGAAPMPVPILESAIATFGCDFLQGYGLTETAGVLTVLRPGDHRYPAGAPAPRRLASIGRQVRCSEVRVADSGGRPVAPDEVGEVVARGANIHAGYWGKPGEPPGSDDGWFHTGDLATVDEQGYIYLVDRLKDMVCVAGENVYPREIENVLMQHPAVSDVAVIGVPHRHWGEEVLGLVVRAPRSECGERELIRHCREHLARFKCPTRIEWRDVIPRNAAGKITKRELREPYWSGRERKV